MVGRQKISYFLLEGIHAFATAYYLFYLFFFLREQFGFGDAANLGVAALHGFVYMFAAWFGGKFSQRAGYFPALRLGFCIMAITLFAAGGVEGWPGQLGLLVIWTFGVCFTWPTLEALVSENESAASLPNMIGLYNVVWAGGGALAYFVGGALMEHLGNRSLFWLPALLHCLQLGILLVLERGAKRSNAGSSDMQPVARAANNGSSPMAKRFLLMAWVANPFAYVAINAAIPVFPTVAEQFHLSKTHAGFFCSIWFFARMFTFMWLWRWPGWHYRFSWLLAANLMMIFSFLIMLLVRHMAVMALAQIVFGCAVGLIYYSSLFYSMDVGETKGEHGGIHEAVIGTGVFGGAAVGALGQHYFALYPNASSVAVSILLAVGLGALAIVKSRPLR